MAIKHALIVDDSKSARLVLKRMLNDLDLEVDMVASAADAIEYLKDNMPDVIFMDHMMPGMDGFEAVKHIKKNSMTAVIPIMMYTSRGGDVYLSQARALGAVGIIPKTISPVGLKESLFKLGLVKDRRISSTLQVEDRRSVDVGQAEKGVGETDSSDKESPQPQAGQIQDRRSEPSFKQKRRQQDDYFNELQKLMDDQTIELHKSMWLGIESVSHEIFNRLNSELEEQVRKLNETKQEEAAGLSFFTGKKRWPMIILIVFLFASLLLNIILLASFHSHEPSEIAVSTTNDVASQAADNNAIDTALFDIQAEDARSKAYESFLAWANNREIEYPFDELALNENRLPVIEELIEKALEAGYSGGIILQTHVGRFCLSRDQNGSYQLADDKLPVTLCEYIGNYVQPYDVPSTHQSLGFANYMSALDPLNNGGISVEVKNISRTVELSSYPQSGPSTTVEEWNLAAKLNNRITIKLDPSVSGSL